MYWKTKQRSEIAARAGIPRSNLSDILHRRRGVSLDLAHKLEAATDGNIPWTTWIKNKSTQHPGFFGLPNWVNPVKGIGYDV